MTVNGYIFRLMAGRYVMLTSVIVTILSLENLPLVIRRLAQFSDGWMLVLSVVADLVPEYVGEALPVATFLATALAFRRLAMNGELDVLAASGLSNLRLLQMPAVVAGAGCLMLIVLTGYVQPNAERALNSVGENANRGAFGYLLKPAAPNRLSANTLLYFDAFDERSGILTGIFVQKDGRTLAGPIGRLALSSSGDGILLVRNGRLLWPAADGLRTAGFDAFRLQIPLRLPRRSEHLTPRERLDELRLDALAAAARSKVSFAQQGVTGAMAAARLMHRIADALFCLTLPLFGVALGVPPKRSRSGIGLAFGFLIILLFWRLGALVEDHFAASAALGFSVLLLVAGSLASLLAGVQQRLGFGAVEDLLARASRQLARPFVPFRLS